MRGASVSLSPPSLYPRSQTIEGGGASHPVDLSLLHLRARLGRDGRHQSASSPGGGSAGVTAASSASPVRMR